MSLSAELTFVAQKRKKIIDQRMAEGKSLIFTSQTFREEYGVRVIFDLFAVEVIIADVASRN